MVTDTVFSEPTGLCCDNCTRKLNPHHLILLLADSSPLRTQPTEINNDNDDVIPSSEVNENGKRPLLSVANRRGVHFALARDALSTWRKDTYERLYKMRGWGMNALLPPLILTTLATRAWLSSVLDYIDIGWSNLLV